MDERHPVAGEDGAVVPGEPDEDADANLDAEEEEGPEDVPEPGGRGHCGPPQPAPHGPAAPDGAEAGTPGERPRRWASTAGRWPPASGRGCPGG